MQLCCEYSYAQGWLSTQKSAPGGAQSATETSEEKATGSGKLQMQAENPHQGIGIDTAGVGDVLQIGLNANVVI